MGFTVAGEDGSAVRGFDGGGEAAAGEGGFEFLDFVALGGEEGCDVFGGADLYSEAGRFYSYEEALGIVEERKILLEETLPLLQIHFAPPLTHSCLSISLLFLGQAFLFFLLNLLFQLLPFILNNLLPDLIPSFLDLNSAFFQYFIYRLNIEKTPLFHPYYY